MELVRLCQVSWLVSSVRELRELETVNMKVEGSTKLEAVTRQQLVNTLTDWEYLVCPIAICKCSIHQITNPKSIYSSHTHDNNFYTFLSSVCYMISPYHDPFQGMSSKILIRVLNSSVDWMNLHCHMSPRSNGISRVYCTFFPFQQMAQHTELFYSLVYLRTSKFLSTFKCQETKYHFVKRIKTIGGMKQIKENRRMEESFYVERKFVCFSPTASFWSFVLFRSSASTSLMCIILFTQEDTSAIVTLPPSSLLFSSILFLI